MFRSHNKPLKRQALQDLTIRARGGIFIYIIVWLVTAFWADIPQNAPLFFYINTAIILLIAILRGAQYLNHAKDPEAKVDVLYRWLVAAVLLGAFHWGVLSAWIIYDDNFKDLRYIYFVTLAAFAIGGTATLSISGIIRFFYPLLIFSPTILLGLFSGDSEVMILIVLAGFSLIYIFEASRVTSKDYWEALSSHHQASKHAQVMEQLSTVDPLTKLGNRAFFNKKYIEEWKSCNRSRSPLTVFMLDLDHFKRLNDTYGHAFGDECLKEVARALQQDLPRETDTIARYGGEEFVILLPSTSLHDAEPIAERLVGIISEVQVFFNKRAVPISCSIGVASAIPDENSDSQHLINAADKALYKAKEEGRNQYRVAREFILDNAGWY